MSKEFSKARKGYKTEEVDSYIRELEDTISKQKERIMELINQASEAESQIKAFKQKQDLISKSILNAVAKAEQIENLTKQKYAFDMAQLKAFHERWLSYYNTLIQKYPLDSELGNLNAFNRAMSKILTGGQDIKQQMTEAEIQFKSETKRLENLKNKKEDDLGIPTFNPEESIRELLRRQLNEDNSKKDSSSNKKPKKVKKAEDNLSEEGQQLASALEEGFSYEDALNPTQSLSEILKEIGLELN